VSLRLTGTGLASRTEAKAQFFDPTLHSSVATAIADVFRKNGINVGRKFARIMKILDKIDNVKSRGVI